MTTPPGPDEDLPRDREEELGADTETWRAFLAGSEEPERPKAVGAPFRIVTLLAGLAVFVVLVLLLLR
jgi:hypothetical protein